MSRIGENDELYITFQHSFSAIRIIDRQLITTFWNLKCEMVTVDEYDEFKFNLALLKLRFWLDHILTNAVIFGKANIWAFCAFVSEQGPITTNQVVITPEEPTDHHLAAVIQSKLNALAEHAFIMASIEIQSDEANGLSYTYIGDAEASLPEMKNWVGDHSWFSKPWWARNDASTFDAIPPQDADLDSPPDFAYSLDFLEEAIKPNAAKVPAKVIQREFRPKVIEGKKDDQTQK
jgi:hypothetical protein